MIKVLLIQNYITSYNLPIYELISTNPSIDLTILHFGKNDTSTKIKQLHFKIKKFFIFYYTNDNLFNICQKFDVVISLADMHYPQLMLLSILPFKKFKLIYWTIGVSASYTNRYDESKRWDFFRFYFYKKADALLFYSDYPITKYIKNGFYKHKLFVAPNTLQILEDKFEFHKKYYILFIGTLYFEKGIFQLLEAYNNVTKSILKYSYKLIIIGDGHEKEKINKWIIENNQLDNIFLKGAIYDEIILKQYFSKSIVCVSPNQAGLSVLKSMGYGVPFITNKNAITGGEIFNIVNNINGMLYEKDFELLNILIDLQSNSNKFLQMGKFAHKYYFENRKPINMANGFIDTINYVLKN